MSLFHMPCSWDCSETRKYTVEVLAAVAQLDPNYAAKIRRFMRQPFLVVSEVLSYALENGQVRDGKRVKYDRAIYMGADIRNDRYAKGLAIGNELEVMDGIIFVSRDGRRITTMETRCDRGIIEVPLILNFE